MSERWLAILWKGKLTTPGGRVFDFDTDWDALTASIVSYSQVFAAPVLGRLPHIDVQHDEARAPVWGSVKELRVLTRDEAADKGVDQPADEALYAKVDVWDGERIHYVSPKLSWNFLADDGVVWPCVLNHVAVVGEPLQQTMQRPQTTLESLAMSREAEMAEVSTEQVDETVDATAEVADKADEAMQVIEELRAQIAELEAQVASLTGAGVETEVVDVEMSRAKAGRATESQIRRIVASALADDRRARDSADIDRVAKSLSMSRKAAEAVHASMSSDEWRKFAGGAASGPAETKPESLNASRAEKLTPAKLDALASAYAKEHKVGYSEAARLIARGR